MKEIPETEMVRYYGELRKMPQAERIEAARGHIENPHGLAETFARSVEDFSSFDPPATCAFHGDDPDRALDKRKFAQSSKTRVFAAALTILGEEVIDVGEDPGLSFRYVDREIVPARAPDARWPGNSKPPQVDLLLAHVDGTPIVAEAKIGDDMDPFFALIQVLAVASQLATPAQLQRLATVYPDRFDPQATHVDAYVITAGTPTGSNWQTFDDLAVELAEALSECDPVTDSIRRLAAVSIQLKANPLYAFGRTVSG